MQLDTNLSLEQAYIFRDEALDNLFPNYFHLRVEFFLTLRNREDNQLKAYSLITNIIKFEKI